MFAVVIGLLAVVVAVFSSRRGLSALETAATAAGFVFAMIAFVVVDRHVDYGGALVGLAALGGALVQWGTTHRERSSARNPLDPQSRT